MAYKIPIMLLLLATLVAAASAATAIEEKQQVVRPENESHRDRRLTSVTAYAVGTRRPGLIVGGSTASAAVPDANVYFKGRKLMNTAVGTAVDAQVINTAVAKSSGATAARITYPSSSLNGRKLMSSTNSVSSSYKKLLEGLKLSISVSGANDRRLMVARPAISSQAPKKATGAIVGGDEVAP